MILLAFLISKIPHSLNVAVLLDTRGGQKVLIY